MGEKCLKKRNQPTATSLEYIINDQADSIQRSPSRLTAIRLIMTVLECEIKSLLARERFARDTAQWKKLRDSYHPDASCGNLFPMPTLKPFLHPLCTLQFSLCTYTEAKDNFVRYDGEIDGFVAASERLDSRSVSIMH